LSEKTRGRLWLNVVLGLTAFLSMLLVFFFLLFFPSLSACVAGLVLPACVSVQSGFSSPSLLSVFFCKTKERSCHFYLQKLQQPCLLALHLLFCSEFGIILAFSQQRAVRDCGLELHSYDYTEGGLCLETNPTTFLAADLYLRLASKL